MIRAISRSVSRKFVLAVLATTFLALSIMAGSMLAYDIASFRASWIDDLTAQADILAQVSTPALEFNDPKAATENLGQVRARPDVLGAGIYTLNGALFAQYRRDDSVAIPERARRAGHALDGNRVTVFKDVSLDGDRVGSIFLSAEYPLGARVSSYAMILFGVMLACLVLAGLVSMWLQKAITHPILSLTEVVGHVVQRRDFSVRVTKSTDDEIGVLVDSFNSMLGEVGQRSAALEASNRALTHETAERRDAEEALKTLNNTLEARIAARTAELEQAHEQLRHAQKMEAIGQLTGGIAHDFNNLLAGMSGNLELMRMRLARGQVDGLERYVKSAMASITRAAALTHRLLAFARRQTLDPKPTDVGRLLHSMEELIRRTVGPAIRVDSWSSADLWNSLCDPNQLESALLNLVINARDALPDGGTLTISSSNTIASSTTGQAVVPDGASAAEYVMIEVADTGTGMPPDVLSRAFDPFFTTKPLGQGTGLGLSMIHGFVTQSDGHIRIASQPDRGTTVTLLLPRYRGALSSSADDDEERSVSKAPSRMTVLIVDDEAAIRTNLAEMLVELGHDVVQAEDGRSGLAVVRSRRRIDLLISDVGLPNGMNGRQLADAARELVPQLKVLFITGYANANVVGNGSMEPGMEVLTKPFTLQAFATKVASMLTTPVLA